jgi:hypothetical protein
MKIAVFCDSIGRIPEFRMSFAKSGNAQHDLVFLVCNNASRSSWRYIAGQTRQAIIRYRIRDWLELARDLTIGRLHLGFGSLNSPHVIVFLERHRPDIGLHAMGVIYREPIIQRCGLGILNAHIGNLPKYRGRSVMEWSILCGDETAVTVFFIDSGIDTGSRIVVRDIVPLTEFRELDAAKRYLFAKDTELYYKAVEKIQAGAALDVNDVGRGFRFYEMSSLFRTILQLYFEDDPRHFGQHPQPQVTGA